MLGVTNPRLTRRLLAPEDRKLQKAVEICRVEEIPSAQFTAWHQIESQTLSNVDAVHHDDVDSDSCYGAAQVDAVCHRQSTSGEDNRISCSRCGRRHQPRRCPTWRKTPGNCRGLNHFAAMCKTKKFNVVCVKAAGSPVESNPQTDERHAQTRTDVRGSFGPCI